MSWLVPSLTESWGGTDRTPTILLMLRKMFSVPLLRIFGPSALSLSCKRMLFGDHPVNLERQRIFAWSLRKDGTHTTRRVHCLNPRLVKLQDNLPRFRGGSARMESRADVFGTRARVAKQRQVIALHWSKDCRQQKHSSWIICCSVELRRICRAPNGGGPRCAAPCHLASPGIWHGSGANLRPGGPRKIARVYVVFCKDQTAEVDLLVRGHYSVPST